MRTYAERNETSMLEQRLEKDEVLTENESLQKIPQPAAEALHHSGDPNMRIKSSQSRSDYAQLLKLGQMPMING